MVNTSSYLCVLNHQLLWTSFDEYLFMNQIGVGQQIEEENNGYAHPVMTQSFGLPNHLQEQFSLPLYVLINSNFLYTKHFSVDF